VVDKLPGAVVVAALALVPIIAGALGDEFYVTLALRILVFALAAIGLNLILGFAGLVSFGHALYIGIGAYAVGVLSSHGIVNGWVHLGAGVLVGAVCATLVGVICLRTTGMAFIMITLAFAQMFYFLAIGLKQYGGDEGISLAQRSEFWPISIGSTEALYYSALVIVLSALFLSNRLVQSRFGMVLQGSRINDQRMRALGFPTLRYRLTAYVLSALVCVIAGVLLANLTRYVSPAYLQWSVSGELIVMVVLGGIGTIIGPVVGAAALVLLEEMLAGLSLGLPGELDALVQNHWKALLGLFIVVVTLVLKRGLYGSTVSPRADQ
jgi:branched-chain amino acid transport system permease protein